MERRKGPKPLVSVSDPEGLLNRIVNRIRQSLELDEILANAAVEMREFLGTDRVKIYRFQADGTGEVIAESMDNSLDCAPLPSLLGLRFPHDDIPPHALQLFLKARQRVIVDVAAQRQIQTRLDCAETGEHLEQEDIRYAPVDPCHAQYLTTMGVISSLVLPILYQGQLWGLLVSHHSQPRRFIEQELNMVQLLADQLSIAIAQATLLSQARRQSWHEATINRISSLLHLPLEIGDIRQQVLEKIVEALQGSGGRLYITAEPTGQPAQLYLCGTQPALSSLEETTFWQKKLLTATHQTDVSPSSPTDIPVRDWATQSLKFTDVAITEHIFQSQLAASLYTINDLYQDPELQSVVSAFKSTSIRSILMVPLQYQQQCVGCLSIFRDEVETQTLWAGRSNQDARNLSPRESFEAWCEIKREQAQQWTSDEVKLAQALGTHLYMAVMQRRVENIVRHQASHDVLTGLPNRLLFNDHLSLALANAHRNGELLAVAFLDLDRFKLINDTLGHAVGDQLLQAAAQRLRQALREGDIIARWGGDEFTLLLLNIDSGEDVLKISKRILDIFSAPFKFKEQEFYIKASIGIALAPYDGEDAETLLKNADTAMYRVKQQGRNNYQIYTPAMNTKAFEQLVLENDLHKALDRHEFLLHYQPQVDLCTGQILAMEALVRWQHSQFGLVPPNQFIPLAEDTGIIAQIGEWVLKTACAQNQAWQKMGLHPFRIAVNLSARQFQQQNLVSMVTQILQETNLDACYLDLEITESIAIQDTKLTINVLQELGNMGIQVSMDDFGTGYSSLSSLVGFPFHVLKIDRSFIHDALTNASKAEIVRAIVTLGHALNLKVVAEGVETSEQVEFLRSIQCDVMQGYFFSRPLPADAITQFMTQRTALAM